MKEATIKIDGVSKRFKIGPKQNLALGIILSILNKNEKKELQVLDNISFTANKGEILGIIGRNGSGKSTLLRTIAGIYLQDKGTIEKKGRVFYISGLDAGLIQRLTMKENIFLGCSILGLSQEEIKKKFNQIVEFSGLKDFVDTDIDKFSSGMLSRLNFSITIHCLEHHNPDIILLDEVFGSGGDIDFQNKAATRMEELIKRGATVILVSHSLEIIEKHCHKVILMDKGKIIKTGSPNETIKFYENTNKTK
jgi:ABC-type polysaccharide/polyol phosphate transport system ATPase subunit